MAAKLLDCEPARTVVVEDAIVGVQAAARGASASQSASPAKGNAEELERNGAPGRG
jgi:beta-phosphoglucomutase-like phosphatase (HAD superfamily)